tara:strand:+ start:40 stop:276 length:237 start_codon:yes stop_codon:yes gene_type:complete
MSFDKTEYERDFAAAMQTKLRLNRKARVKAFVDAHADNSQIEHKSATELAISIAEEGMREHPGLTKDKALQMLREFGL